MIKASQCRRMKNKRHRENAEILTFGYQHCILAGEIESRMGVFNWFFSFWFWKTYQQPRNARNKMQKKEFDFLAFLSLLTSSSHVKLYKVCGLLARFLTMSFAVGSQPQSQELLVGWCPRVGPRNRMSRSHTECTVPWVQHSFTQKTWGT